MRMSVTDEALALAAAAGDREAFAALLERRYDGCGRLREMGHINCER